MQKSSHSIKGIAIPRRYTKNLPYNSKLKQRAGNLRKAGVLSEGLFWQEVHKGKFWNIDFDRQKIIDNYIVDFYVKSLSLVIEIDGDSHIDKEEYDKERQDFLEALGLIVYRISDEDVKTNISGVLIALEDFIIQNYGNTQQ